jgi:hypothetical protein
MFKAEPYLFSLRLRLSRSGGLIPILILIIIIVGVACGTREGHAKLPAGYVDAPPMSGQAVFRGATPFEGWALADDGIEEVAVYIDRQFVAAAQTGVERPDVAKSLPKEPNAGRAGWRTSVDVSNFPAGVHEVVVQATAKNGAKRDIAAFQATIAK